MAKARRYFVRASEPFEEKGPYKLAVLERSIADGRISKTVLVRREGKDVLESLETILLAKAADASELRERERQEDARERDDVAETARSLGIQGGGGRERGPLFWMAIGFFVVGFGGMAVSHFLWAEHGRLPLILFGGFVTAGLRFMFRSWKHEKPRQE